VRGHFGPINTVAFHPSGKRCAFCDGWFPKCVCVFVFMCAPSTVPAICVCCACVYKLRARLSLLARCDHLISKEGQFCIKFVRLPRPYGRANAHALYA